VIIKEVDVIIKEVDVIIKEVDVIIKEVDVIIKIIHRQLSFTIRLLITNLISFYGMVISVEKEKV
jgi:hypothetical protein